MEIRLAQKSEIDQLNYFFEQNLDKNNDAIPSEEFLCPFGLKAAVKRNQVMVGMIDRTVVAAVRFYPRKSDQIVSIYQFAVDPAYQGQNLLQKVLIFTGYKKFEARCPIRSKFNDYYQKTNWVLNKKDTSDNYWLLSL